MGTCQLGLEITRHTLGRDAWKRHTGTVTRGMHWDGDERDGTPGNGNRRHADANRTEKGGLRMKEET